MTTQDTQWICREYTLPRSGSAALGNLMQDLLSCEASTTSQHQIGSWPSSQQRYVTTYFRLRFRSRAHLDRFHNLGYITSEPVIVSAPAEVIDHLTKPAARNTLRKPNNEAKPMTAIQDYLAFIPRTYPTRLTREQSISNCVMGLVGELNEWLTTDWRSEEELLEAGDILYYIATFCRVLDIDFADLWGDVIGDERVDDEVDLWDIIDTLADVSKKHLYYSPPHTTESEYQVGVQPILLTILGKITHSQDIEEIMAANIAKLTARYQPSEA